MGTSAMIGTPSLPVSALLISCGRKPWFVWDMAAATIWESSVLAVTQNLPVLAAQSNANSNQFLPAFTLAAGPPVFAFPTVPSNGQLPLAGPNCFLGNTSQCIQPHIRPTNQRLPYVDTWIATVQHQVTNTMTLEVTYLGNKGTHGFVGDGPTYNVN